MPLWFSCPTCGRIQQFADEQAGSVAACQVCGERMFLPAAARPAEPPPPPPLPPLPEVVELDESAIEPRFEACVNHRNVPFEARCGDCDQPFCSNCLIRFQERTLCAVCKNHRAKQLKTPQTSSTAAYVSLAIALPSLFCACAGIILGPIAVVLGLVGLVAIERDPLMKGRAWAMSGIALGLYTFLFNLIVLILMMKGGGLK